MTNIFSGMKRSFGLIFVLTVLFGSVIAGIGKDARPKVNPPQISDLYLTQLVADGLSVDLVERGMDKERFLGWKRFLSGTFRVSFLFDGAERVVCTEARTGQSYALFVFQTPREFTQSVVQFSELIMHGGLRSKFAHKYYAVASEKFFAILLSENKPKMPDLLCTTLSKVIRGRLTKDRMAE